MTGPLWLSRLLDRNFRERNPKEPYKKLKGPVGEGFLGELFGVAVLGFLHTHTVPSWMSRSWLKLRTLSLGDMS